MTYTLGNFAVAFCTMARIVSVMVEAVAGLCHHLITYFINSLFSVEIPVKISYD
jgi:hypothetical protein